VATPGHLIVRKDPRETKQQILATVVWEPSGYCSPVYLARHPGLCSYALLTKHVKFLDVRMCNICRILPVFLVFVFSWHCLFVFALPCSVWNRVMEFVRTVPELALALTALRDMTLLLPELDHVIASYHMGIC
jgi:hypothetical protein